MNLSEHPLAVDIVNRIASVEGDFIAATVLLPGMPNLMGELRNPAPGLFALTTNVKLEGGPQQAPGVGRVDFTFTADRPVAILYPSATEAPEPSRIVSPH